MGGGDLRLPGRPGVEVERVQHWLPEAERAFKPVPSGTRSPDFVLRLTDDVRLFGTRIAVTPANLPAAPQGLFATCRETEGLTVQIHSTLAFASAQGCPR